MQKKESWSLARVMVVWVTCVVFGTALMFVALEAPRFMVARSKPSPTRQLLPTLPMETVAPVVLSANEECVETISMGVDEKPPIQASNLGIVFRIDQILTGSPQGALAMLSDGRTVLRVGDPVSNRQGDVVGMVTAIHTESISFCQIK